MRAAEPVLDTAALRSVSKDEFDRVWSVYSYLQQAELHINDLQSHYRTLASTWLLATFGAAGFLVTDDSLALPIDSPLLASAVCVLGTVGVLLLWNLDLLVYQGLLRARFYIGRDMEAELPWLPPVRRRMLIAFPSGTTPRVATFYVAATSVPLVLGAALFCLWIGSVEPAQVIPSLVVWLAAVAGIAAFVASKSGMRLRRRPASGA
jgi:hypothetical protein